MAAGIIILVFIENEILAVFLNGIVGEMHVKVIKIAALGPNVFFRCKSR